VRGATLARVGCLSASARSVVDAAAMFGQRISPALLAAVVPGSGDLVEEAIACGVLTDDGRTLGFRHELIRQPSRCRSRRRGAPTCMGAWSRPW
jgi:hypothetical protein